MLGVCELFSARAASSSSGAPCPGASSPTPSSYAHAWLSKRTCPVSSTPAPCTNSTGNGVSSDQVGAAVSRI